MQLAAVNGRGKCADRHVIAYLHTGKKPRVISIISCDLPTFNMLNDVLVLSLCGFLGNVGVGITGFGMAIIYIFVWQVSSLSGELEIVSSRIENRDSIYYFYHSPHIMFTFSAKTMDKQATMVLILSMLYLFSLLH